MCLKVNWHWGKTRESYWNNVGVRVWCACAACYSLSVHFARSLWDVQCTPIASCTWWNIKFVYIIFILFIFWANKQKKNDLILLLSKNEKIAYEWDEFGDGRKFLSSDNGKTKKKKKKTLRKQQIIASPRSNLHLREMRHFLC